MVNGINDSLFYRAAFVSALALAAGPGHCVAEEAEVEIGEARVKPGILFIFEAKEAEETSPAAQNLSKDSADLLLEGRANWDEKGIPAGATPGSFVGYINMNVQITNERTGQKAFTNLIPHVNTIDNQIYARNIALPGRKTDLYTVDVFVNPPDPFALALAKDWRDAYGSRLFAPQKFTFTRINFERVVEAH